MPEPNENLTNQSQELVKDSPETKPVDGKATQAEPVEAGKTTPEPEEEFDEIVYNKETVKIPKSERKTYLQKGKHYDEVRSERDKARDLIKSLGYEKLDDFEKAVQMSIVRERAKAIVEQNPGVSDDQAMTFAEQQTKADWQTQEAERIKMEARNLVQKAALKDKPLFAELEHDIDEVLKANPTVDMETAYQFVLGKRMASGEIDKLLEKKSVKALENHERQSKRGVEASDDAPVSAEKGIDFNAEEKAWAERQVGRGVYTSLHEAWEWLRGKK